MTVDPRCWITTDLGVMLDGSGLSEDHVQGLGLVTYRGTWIFDGIHTPARGQLVQMAYARPQYGTSGTLTRFHPRLHVISSSADPFANGGNGLTTVEVGCLLNLMRDRKDPVVYRAIDHPPAWWSALTADRRATLPPTIEVQGVIDYCLAALGIPLAAGSATTTDVKVQAEIDLSSGYVQVLDDFLRSALLFGYITPAGELLVQRVTLAPGEGPVLRRENLIELQPINDRGGAEQVSVEFDAIEAPANLTPGTIEVGSEQQQLRDWELERTIGPPTTFMIEAIGRRFRIGVGLFQELEPENRYQIPVVVTQVSETRSKYKTFTYTDIDGKQQSQDLVIQRTSTRRSTLLGKLYFSMLSSYVFFGTQAVPAYYFPPSGAIPYNEDQITEYTYEITKEGPRLKSELTRTFDSPAKYATSLPIDNWVFADEVVSLPATNFEVSRVLVENEVDEASGLTKRKTTRWTASAKTQPGSQAARLAFEGIANSAQFLDTLVTTSPLVMEGVEVSISLGRQAGLQSRPSAQDRARDNLLGRPPVGDPLGSSGTTTSSAGQGIGQVVTASYAFGGAGTEPWNTSSYVLPYAPDDFIYGVNGSTAGVIDLYLTRGQARQRALEYGQLRNAMEFGHANGVAVTTAPWELPSPPFSPLYIDASGTSTAFRTNGRNWEVRNGCMVVTADLMLVGTAGRLAGATPIPWVPLPADPMVLNELGAPTGSGELIPANTIDLPSGFDPAAPGAVWGSLPDDGSDTYGPRREPAAVLPPYRQRVKVLARCRSIVVVTELDYVRTQTQDTVVAVSRSVALVIERASRERVLAISRSVALVTET